MTKYIGVVSNGEYFGGANSAYGRKTLRKTAKSLKQFFQNKKGILFYSSDCHSAETARIIKSVILPEEDNRPSESLYGENYGIIAHELFPQINTLKDTIDYVVLISGPETVNNFVVKAGLRKALADNHNAKGFILAVENWKDVTMPDIMRKTVFATVSHEGVKPVFNF